MTQAHHDAASAQPAASAHGGAWAHVAARGVVALTRVQRRVLITLFAIIGPRQAYALAALLARGLYALLPPLRVWSERNCAAALGDRLGQEAIVRLARAAFVHRIWNLTDLYLAERFLRRQDLDRRGGHIAEPELTRLKAAQSRGQPFLLITIYLGPFDLLPLLLGWNGVVVPTIYRAHANQPFDAFRRRIRGLSGCELLPVEEAFERLPQILERGGGAALLIDHHVERGGVPIRLLGAETTVSRAPGILAARFAADVVVAGIVRMGGAFRFSVPVIDTIDHAEFAERPDAVAFIMKRYVRAVERLILTAPEQYLWVQDRWGHRNELSQDQAG